MEHSYERKCGEGSGKRAQKHLRLLYRSKVISARPSWSLGDKDAQQRTPKFSMNRTGLGLSHCAQSLTRSSMWEEWLQGKCGEGFKVELPSPPSSLKPSLPVAGGLRLILMAFTDLRWKLALANLLVWVSAFTHVSTFEQFVFFFFFFCNSSWVHLKWLKKYISGALGGSVG